MVTRRMARSGPRLAVCACMALAGSCGPGPGPGDDFDALRSILVAEDARPSDGALLDTLVGASESGDARSRRYAVRALGRLEDPALIASIAPALDDPEPLVRVAAAEAIAQAVHGASGESALEPLLERARDERDPAVRGAIAHALGRLTLPDAEVERALGPLLLWSEEEGLAGETVTGLVLGLEEITRRPGTASDDSRPFEALGRLFDLADTSPPADPNTRWDRVRTVALTALGQRGRADPLRVDRGLRDPAPTVRAAAVRFFGPLDTEEREARILDALEDSAVIVRGEAARSLDVAERTPVRCAALLRAARDMAMDGVRLVATDALAVPCEDPVATEIRSHLAGVASAVDDPSVPWGWKARSLRSLAELDPAAAARLLGAHARASEPFLRAAAADVATLLADGSVLALLADDGDPNVRNAALPGLFGLEGRGIDERLVTELRQNDAQLLLTVVGLLDGSAHPALLPTALEALGRLTESERETWRDPRVALLGLIERVGGADDASALEPYLTDFDPVVATRAAEVLSSWTGSTRHADPAPLPAVPLPDAGELRELTDLRVRLHMARGGVITIAPRPLMAATNAYRFVRLAREGYFDGLTFHRWAPNFVIQGGSPGANEYAGAPRYSRDEIGPYSHWRGTVGLSTRGRDTGDAQIFVNLIDNVRLDHEYTVFGEVVDGMDVVDAVLPGDVIERVEVTGGH